MASRTECGTRLQRSYLKLPFYAGHSVNEVVIVEPAARTISWLELVDDEYVPVERSELLGLDVADLAAQIDWPPSD